MHGVPRVRSTSNRLSRIFKARGLTGLSFSDVGRWMLAVCVLLVFYGSTAAAHHSFAAEYDGKKPTTLSGTVTKVEWTNPHVHFFLDVKDARRIGQQAVEAIGASHGG